MINLSTLRGAEFECVKQYFHSGMRVLEVGGGSGYQASLIAALGVEVECIDVAPPPVGGETFYPIRMYDGKVIPFPSGSFDVIFSSKVLEHVAHLEQLLAEFHRVMKADGLAIHILPSPSWRLWTRLAHYGHLGKLLLARRSDERSLSGSSKSFEVAKSKRSILAIAKRAIWAGPHCEYPSAFSELWCFSAARWRQVFRSNGFDVVSTMNSAIFYTGYSVLPRIPLGAWRGMARLLGAATRIYITRARR